MKIYELDYKGKKVNASQSGYGYSVQLPDVPSENRMYAEHVSIDGNGCKFTSSCEEEPEYFVYVWLRKDGTIEYSTDRDNKIHIMDYKLADMLKYPNLETFSKFPYNIASEMYNITDQLQYLVKIQTEVNGLRKKRLELALQRLGYDSIESALSPIENYSTTCNLSEIADELESYEDLTTIKGFSRKKGKDIIYREPSAEDRENIMELLKRVIDEIKQMTAQLEDEREMTQRKRDLSREFATRIPAMLSRTDDEWKNFSKQVILEGRSLLNPDSQTEEVLAPKYLPQSIVLYNRYWIRYTEQVEALAKIYLGLNADLLDKKTAKQIEDLTRLKGIEVQDKIASVLDSYKFDDAAHIENIFVCAMNQELMRELQVTLKSNEALTSTGLGGALRELYDDCRGKVEGRMARIAHYEKKQELMKKMETVTHVNITAPKNGRNGHSAPGEDDDDGLR